jgi:hypothetical protein
MVFVEIMLAVAAGILLARWISTWPHKLRVRNYAKMLLTLDMTQRLLLALEGYDEIFSKQDRDWLIQLSFSDNKKEKAELCRKIAEDTADRWHKMGSGKGADMKSMMSEAERAEIQAARRGIDELADAVKMAEALGKKRP